MRPRLPARSDLKNAFVQHQKALEIFFSVVVYVMVYYQYRIHLPLTIRCRGFAQAHSLTRLHSRVT